MARHAQEIHALVLAIRGSVNHTGFKIKGRTRLRAERVVADRGMANDLKHLLSAAESGSKRRWHTAWPKVSGQARDLVVGWKPSRPPVVERNKRDSRGRLIIFRRAAPDLAGLNSINARGLSMLYPQAAVALPLICEAIRKLEAAPAATRRQRKPDSAADDLVRAACRAHRALTGRLGVTSNPKTEKWQGSMIELGRRIDANSAPMCFRSTASEEILSGHNSHKQARKLDRPGITSLSAGESDDRPAFSNRSGFW